MTMRHGGVHDEAPQRVMLPGDLDADIRSRPVASAQVPASDANHYMQVAAEANSLTAADMKPWHLRAKYQQSDPEEAAKDPGILEIWWAGPKNYRVSYTSSEFTQAEYRVGDKMFLTGQDGWAPLLERKVLYLLVHPLPDMTSLRKDVFMKKDVSLGGGNFGCYTAPQNPKPGQLSSREGYCFDPSDPALRLMINNRGFITSFNKVIRLQSHYVATHIHSELSKVRTIDIDVDQVDASLGAEPSTLVPPADARLSPAPAIDLGGSWAAPTLPPRVVHSVEPELPESFERNHPRTETVVLVSLVVDEAGRPEDRNAIGGPLELQQAAMLAVSQYRFKPAMCMNRPLEVEMIVEVRFRTN